LKDREQGSLLHKLGFRAAEVERILGFEEEGTMPRGKSWREKSWLRRSMRFGFWRKCRWKRWRTCLAFSSNSGAVSKISRVFEQVASAAAGNPGDHERAYGDWNGCRTEI